MDVLGAKLEAIQPLACYAISLDNRSDAVCAPGNLAFLVEGRDNIRN